MNDPNKPFEHYYTNWTDWANAIVNMNPTDINGRDYSVDIARKGTNEAAGQNPYAGNTRAIIDTYGVAIQSIGTLLHNEDGSESYLKNVYPKAGYKVKAQFNVIKIGISLFF